MATEAAILVPGHVGDPLDHTNGFDERLDPVALVARRVTVAGQSTDPEEAVVGEQFGGRRAVFVEPLQPHCPVVPGRGARPPRTAVVRVVAGCRCVDVGGHLGHLALGEHPPEVEVARFGQEVGHFLRIVAHHK